MPYINTKFRSTQPKVHNIRSTCETDKKAERAKLYATVEWSRLRKWKLQEMPFCEICLAQGRYTPASSCHHLDSFKRYANQEAQRAVAFNSENIISICHRCHGKIHQILGETNGQSVEELVKILEEDKKNKNLDIQF